MFSKINSQEIYLLERYSSLAYFGELRDAWKDLINHVESCLQWFMHDIPLGYRSSPLSEQPDIVWGERVLPNFRDTMQGLNTGYILLSHGDAKGLHYAWGVSTDFKGQKEFSSEWMGAVAENMYGELLYKTVTMAGNICATEGGYWKPLSLTKYSGDRGPLELPEQWPVYQINTSVSVRTGQKTLRSGIYVPDVGNSCAEFLSVNYKEAPLAKILIGYEDLLHPTTGEEYGEQAIFETQKCTWFLVERTGEFEAGPIGRESSILQNERVAAGEACPETGFYFTPAHADSRRHFKAGDIMPDFGSAYGTTIWQWDSDQA